MSTGTMFLLAGLLFLAYLVVVRAFSADARAVDTDREAGCMLAGIAIVLLVMALAIDHLSVGFR